MQRIHLAALALTLTAASVAAQVPDGSYISCVRSPNGEMFFVDPATQTTTKLTISAALEADWVNCIEMVTPSMGYIGTLNNPAVYRIDIAGTTVTETQLNTNAFVSGSEVVQVSVVGNTLYCAQGQTNNLLWSVPTAGGAATQMLDMSTLPGWRVGGIVNSLAANLTDVYFAVWTVGELYCHNLASGTTTLLLTLPTSKLPAAGFFPVNMQLSAPKLASTQLNVVGLYGDVASIDLTSGTVTDHYYAAAAAPTGYNGLFDSFAENTDNGDWGLGSRDGSLNVLVPVGAGGLGREDVAGVGSGATPNLNRVVGMWYNAAGADYKPYGEGCAGVGGFIPTSVGRGAPIAGNAAFGFGVDSTRNGTATALLIVGVNNAAPIDLSIVGAPGCFQRTDIVLLIGSSATGTADGLGMGTVAAPVPMGFTATVHTQWAVFDPTNNFGIVMSDARTLRL